MAYKKNKQATINDSIGEETPFVYMMKDLGLPYDWNVDFTNRQQTLLYIDGEVVIAGNSEDDFHVILHNEYCKKHPEKKKNEIPFATGNICNNMVFLNEYLYNCTIDEVVNAIKKQCNFEKIYTIVGSEESYKRLAKRRLIKANDVDQDIQNTNLGLNDINNNINTELFEKTFNDISNKGRSVLKNIEEYSFFLNQSAKIVGSNQDLSKQILQKQKELSRASNLLFSIVTYFDNYDITDLYQLHESPVNITNYNAPVENHEEKPKEDIEENNIEEKNVNDKEDGAKNSEDENKDSEESDNQEEEQ